MLAVIYPIIWRKCCLLTACRTLVCVDVIVLFVAGCRREMYTVLDRRRFAG